MEKIRTRHVKDNIRKKIEVNMALTNTNIDLFLFAPVQRKKNRITIMLIIVLIIFLVCITPDALISLIIGEKEREGERKRYKVKEIREDTKGVTGA